MAAIQKSVTGNNNVKKVQKVQSEENTAELDLTELLYKVWDGKWLIVILAVLGIAVMAVYSTYFAVKKYRAQSVLYIGNNDNSMVSLNDLQIGASLTKDYIKVFEFWEVHEEVADIIQSDEYMREKYDEKTLRSRFSAGAVRGKFSVENPQSTRLLYIRVTSDDPIEAAKIANAYAEAGRTIISTKMNIDKEKSLPVISRARDGSNEQDADLSNSQLKSVAASKVAPQKTKNIILGFTVGVLLALVIITIRFLTDTKVRTENDVRKCVDLPVLAVVPVMRKNGDKRKSGLARKFIKKDKDD